MTRPDPRGSTRAIWRCPRCGVERATEFSWAHRPLGSDIRTCGGDPAKVVVPVGHELVVDPIVVDPRFPDA